MKRILFGSIAALAICCAFVALRSKRAWEKASQPYPEQSGETLAFSVNFPSNWQPVRLSGNARMDTTSASLEGSDPILGNIRVFIDFAPEISLPDFIKDQTQHDMNASKVETWTISKDSDGKTWTTFIPSVDNVPVTKNRIVARDFSGRGVISALIRAGNNREEQLRAKYLITRILASIELKAPKPAKK